jgi:hypothetical protein
VVLTLLHGLALAAVFSVLQECARVCPILAKYFRHRAFPMEQVEGKGKKKLRRQVAGAAPALPALLSSAPNARPTTTSALWRQASGSASRHVRQCI